jgi:hypothetical protein
MTDGGGLGDDTTQADQAPPTEGKEPLTRTSESITPPSIPMRRCQVAVRDLHGSVHRLHDEQGLVLTFSQVVRR